MPIKNLSIARIKARLISELASDVFTEHIDDKGYVAQFHQNLLPAVQTADFEADLQQGDGNELESKFRAVHSSSALAVNCFAPFKRHLPDLYIAGFKGFTSLTFEQKCPTGLKSRRSPNLDLVLQAPDHVLAIESKFTEYFSKKAPKFSPAYETEITDHRRQQAWFLEMLRLQVDPSAYTRLDVAQLIKHAFGLMHCYPDKPVTLLYLYWEPEPPFVNPLFQQHRDEIAKFSQSIAGSDLRFMALSYQTLWRQWQDTRPDWLQAHRQSLLNRYDINMARLAL